MSAMKTKRWLPWCVGGLLLGAGIAWSAERDSAKGSGQAASEQTASAQSDPTHCYYVVFKGVKQTGEGKQGIFEAQAEWTLKAGLQKIESRKLKVPAGSEVAEEDWHKLAKGGWYARYGHSVVLIDDPGGIKRGYPPPRYWVYELRGMGKPFDAVVAGVTPTDQGASVQLTLLREHSEEDGAKESAKKPVRDVKKETVTVSWKNALGPVPVAKGQEVVAHVTAQREVLEVTYDAVPRFWRKAPDGKIEIAFNPNPNSKGPAPGLLLLKPTGLHQGSTFAHWLPELGVFLYEEEAGSPSLDSASLPSDKSGIQLINVPNFRLQPGRDGWKRAKHSEEGYWEDCPEVPEDQETSGAG
jgi:hypothetical protein